MKSYHQELSKSPNLVTLVRRKLTSQVGYGAVYRVQCDQFWRNFTTLARRKKTLAILKGFIN